MSIKNNNDDVKNKEKKSGGAKRRNKGEVTIRKKGNSYEGRVTVEINGVKKQVSVSDKDKRVVIQKMAEARNDAANNSYITNSNITVKEWMKKWINIYKRGTVRNKTLSGYIGYIKQYINPEIGDYELQKVKPIHIKQVLQKMLNGECKTTTKKLALKTVKETYNVLNMAFHEAAENELVKNNCVEKVERPKPRKKEPKIMTREEQKQFESMLSGKYDFTVYLFLLKTGERASEASGTNWEDIDFENKVINVVNGLVLTARYNEDLEIECNELEDTDLKSESSIRKIPMLFEVEKLLKDYREQYMQVNGITTIEELKGKPLFLTNNSNRIKADFLWKKLDKFLKKEGFRHIGVHQLRHTFATRCLEARVSPKYLQKLLGHSTPEMTNLYTHLLEEFETEENEKIDEYYANKVAKNEKSKRKTYKGKIKGKLKIIRKIA